MNSSRLPDTYSISLDRFRLLHLRFDLLYPGALTAVFHYRLHVRSTLLILICACGSLRVTASVSCIARTAAPTASLRLPLSPQTNLVPPTCFRRCTSVPCCLFRRLGVVWLPQFVLIGRMYRRLDLLYSL